MLLGSEILTSDLDINIHVVHSFPNQANELPTLSKSYYNAAVAKHKALVLWSYSMILFFRCSDKN
jgi:hypothetical protein